MGKEALCTQKQKLSLLYYLLPPVFLAALTVFFYFPSLTYDFQFDDIANITKHFKIRHSTLSTLFFSGTRWISYWLNTVHYSIGKFNPLSYRVGNLIIHISNGILIFFILLLALRHASKKNFFTNNAFILACTTALLFLLHPVQTQTVSYVIQGQLEGLAALFSLSMVLCFLLLSYTHNNAIQYTLTGLLFTLGIFACGTKEIAIICPALLVLIDWFFVAQGNWKDLKSRLWLHLSLALMMTSIYIYFLKPSFFTEILGLKRIAKNNLGNMITEQRNDIITPWIFFISQFKVILHYLWMFIFPFNISVEYDWVLSRSFFALDCLLPLSVLLGLSCLIIQRLRSNSTHLIVFGALWFALCIAPRSSIIPSPELLVDYKTYLASFGWLFIIATALVWTLHATLPLISSLPAQLKKHTLTPLAGTALLGVLFGFVTMQRNKVWRSGLEFWGNMVANAPGKARAYNNYGVELSQLKRFEESIPYFKKAIEMDKQYPDPLNNLAVAYSNLKKVDLAIDALKRGLQINRFYPEGYNNLASFYLQKKEYEKAEKCLQTALKLRPHYGKAYFNLGRLNLDKNDMETAWECFKKACTEADFDVPHGFDIYGKVSVKLKKYEDAIFAFTKRLELEPHNLEGMFQLANAYYLNKEFPQAIKLYETITRNKHNDIRSWYNLGESYFATQQYNKALTCFKQIYPMRMQVPQVHLRMAGCFEKLGNQQQAKHILQEFLKLHYPKSNPALENMRTIAARYLNTLQGTQITT